MPEPAVDGSPPTAKDGGMNTMHLEGRCPRCGGEIHEEERAFSCHRCPWKLSKTILGRDIAVAEAEELFARGKTARLAGFRSKQGRAFEACLKLGAAPEFKVGFEFAPPAGSGTSPGRDGTAAPPDFSGLTALGTCPACGGRVFETAAEYHCERAAGTPATCRLRVAKVILKKEIQPGDVARLLKDGSTGLLNGFVSRKNGRTFDAYLTVRDGNVAFAFPASKEPGRGAEPRPVSGDAAVPPTPGPQVGPGKLDTLGKCPRCGGRVVASAREFLCEHSQREDQPCGFRAARVILEQSLSPEQMARILNQGRSDLLTGFVSRKSGRTFSAYLVMDAKGQVTFEFPAREPARKVVGAPP